MIQFARTVILEVSLASYGLWRICYCVNERGAGNFGVRGQPGCSIFSSVVGSVLVDSVVSQMRYLMPTKSGFTTTVAIVGTVQSREVRQSTFVQNLNVVRTESAVLIP